MSTNSNRQFITVFLLLMLAVPLLTLAQAEITSTPTSSTSLVYACIDVGTNDPYLITLRDADMTTHIVGFVVPRTANVTIYSPTGTTTGVAVYAIAPDAATGGYQRHGLVGKVFARDDIADQDRPCSSQYSDIILDSLSRTIPLPVSKDQAVIVQFGGDNLLENADFLGVFTLHFRSTTNQLNEDFQIIQLSGGGIEISFPFIKDDTRLILIGNKYVNLWIGFTQTPGDFEAQVNTNPTDGFSQLLAREPVSTVVQNTLNLFQIMNEGAVRIYPAFGAVFKYPTSGFLRLEMSPVGAKRDEFIVDGNNPIMIRAIKGLEAKYFTLTNRETPYNTLTNPPDLAVEPKTLEVIGIDENTDELLVKTLGGDAFIESWFVEVIPPQ